MVSLPKMYRIGQKLPRPKVEDVSLLVHKELDKLGLDKKIIKDKVIAITGGSRGITNIDLIYREVASFVKDKGGCPIIISAMGSHGGGTVEGQKEILSHLGVSEQTTDCPVIASTKVVELGKTPTHGVTVFCAEEAVEAHGIIVINRVKAHTAFRAARESGLLKMLGIGLGRAPGAESIHSHGPDEIGQIILELSRIVREKINVLAGLAIVENGYEETAMLKALAPEEFEEEEAKLLDYSKELMPRIPFEDLDLLLIDEMGKNYSGTGMDTNVIGRWRIHGAKEPDIPRINRIAVFDLSEASQGNANGIGLVDFTTRRLVDKIDYKATYLNAITTGFTQRVMLPITLSSDKEVVETAIKTIAQKDLKDLKIVRIKNTLFLEELYCSEALLKEIGQNKSLIIKGGQECITFDEHGSFSNNEW